MKKAIALSVIFCAFFSCQKKDSQDTSNYDWSYEGDFREKDSYIKFDGDTSWVENTDDTSFNNTFHIKGHNNSNTLTRILGNGQSVVVKDNFQFDSNNTYEETSGGGSSYHFLSIRVEGDSLLVSEKRASGIANSFSSFIRAKRTN